MTEKIEKQTIEERVEAIEEAIKDMAEFTLYSCGIFELLFQKLNIPLTKENKYESKRTDN